MSLYPRLSKNIAHRSLEACWAQTSSWRSFGPARLCSLRPLGAQAVWPAQWYINPIISNGIENDTSGSLKALFVSKISPSGFFVTEWTERRGEEDLRILVVGWMVFHDFWKTTSCICVFVFVSHSVMEKRYDVTIAATDRQTNRMWRKV